MTNGSDVKYNDQWKWRQIQWPMEVTSIRISAVSPQLFFVESRGGGGGGEGGGLCLLCLCKRLWGDHKLSLRTKMSHLKISPMLIGRDGSTAYTSSWWSWTSFSGWRVTVAKVTPRRSELDRRSYLTVTSWGPAMAGSVNQQDGRGICTSHSPVVGEGTEVICGYWKENS